MKINHTFQNRRGGACSARPLDDRLSRANRSDDFSSFQNENLKFEISYSRIKTIATGAPACR